MALSGLSALVIATTTFVALCANGIVHAQVQSSRTDTMNLQPYATIDFPPIDESSGIVRSRRLDNVYWTHNDSGDDPRIFALRRNGDLVKPAWDDSYKGLAIPDAVNIDWEDIAIDDAGNLIIGAFGNNGNARRDLAVYIVPEPHPEHVNSTRTISKIAFHYPDQIDYPPQKRNFDCEAMFWAYGKLYLLTKHRSDSFTKLYRLDSTAARRSNALTLLGSFDAQGYVTAADVSADGRRLAMLTYTAIWLFEAPANSDDYFNGSIRWLPIKARQCEAICFDGADLMITNEQRDLFRVPITLLAPRKP